MSVLSMRLGLGIFFLSMAGLIFARSWIAPGLDAKFNTVRLNLGGVLALVFAGLNFARWYALWSYRRQMTTPVRTPLQPDPSLVAPEPPNPDLDFTKAEKTEEKPAADERR